MKVYEGKDSLRNIYQPYLDEIYSSVWGRGSPILKVKNWSFYSILKDIQILLKRANFSLEDTGSRSVLGYSRNSACIVFIISTNSLKLFQNELFQPTEQNSCPHADVHFSSICLCEAHQNHSNIKLLI